MKIGFTGTRLGMNDLQKVEVRRILGEYTLGRDTEVHHGDCIGADTDFHNICYEMWFLILIHPSNLSTRAWNRTGVIKFYEPKAPLVRDHDIVDSVDVLIATPAQNYEVLRSGTWATIRYAKKVGRVIHVIMPK